MNGNCLQLCIAFVYKITCHGCDYFCQKQSYRSTVKRQKLLNKCQHDCFIPIARRYYYYRKVGWLSIGLLLLVVWYHLFSLFR